MADVPSHLSTSTTNSNDKVLQLIPQENIKKEIVVPMEFEQNQHYECLVCVKKCSERFDIYTNYTDNTGISLFNFLKKYNKSDMPFSPDNQYICSCCLNLVNILESAEIEYFNLKGEFELIISKNPIFNSSPVELGRVKTEVQSDGEDTNPASDGQEKSILESLLEAKKNNEDQSNNLFKINTVIKIERTDDVCQPEMPVTMGPTREKDKAVIGKKKDKMVIAKKDKIVVRKKNNAVVGKNKAAVGRKVLVKGTPQPNNAKMAKAVADDDYIPLESYVETVMADSKQTDSSQQLEAGQAHFSLQAQIKEENDDDSHEQRFIAEDGSIIGSSTQTLQPIKQSELEQAQEFGKNDVSLGEGPYECHVCFHRFPFGTHLKMHMASHVGEKLYKCHLCQRGFTQKHSLLQHLRLHTGERPFQCEVCNRGFTQKHNLRMHLRTHTGEKPFQCSECDRSFCTNNSLRNHARTHTGENPFKCYICHHHFSHKNNLQNHLRIHTGEKPFECHVCKRKFSQKNNLRSHLRLHTGEKPFKCDLCHQSFNRRSRLEEHLRTHTGEKPFECEICRSHFNSKYTLGRHYKNLHGIKISSLKLSENRGLNSTSVLLSIKDSSLKASIVDDSSVDDSSVEDSSIKPSDA